MGIDRMGSDRMGIGRMGIGRMGKIFFQALRVASGFAARELELRGL